MTDEEFARWPKCAVPACRNKCCLRLKSRYCWPHTPGQPSEARKVLEETEGAAQASRSASAGAGSWGANHG